MENNTVPELNRRKKEAGVVSHITETLIGKQSRKVAFGIWLFAVATTLLKTALITADIWWKCVLLAGSLIGFGTILDDVLMKFGDKISGVVAKKVNTVIETTETTIVAPTPPTPPNG